MNKSEITGAVGAVPPADAPIENAQPLHPETIQVQQSRAAANEKTLPPFASPQPRKVGMVNAGIAGAVAVAAAVKDKTADLIADVFGHDAPTTAPVKAVSDVGGPRVPAKPSAQPDRSVVVGQGQPVPQIDPQQEVVDQMDDVLPELSDEDRLRMPAASNTDTPAKGLLPDLTPPKGDKFEGVQRGGFSDLADAQYFPLQGDELLQLVLALFDDLAARIPNDLRFSMALTYPRVRAIVEVRIEGHVEDDNSGFVIKKIAAPKAGEKGGTAEDIARARANQVVFVVQAMRQEFTPEGESEHPPDAMRDELGLRKPRKQIIETTTGQQFVDVVSPGSDLAALTR